MVRRQQPPRAGRRALAYLADTGVDASRVSVGDDPSTRSVVLSDPDGERAIVTAGESFRRLRLDEADRGALAAAETVFATGYTPDAVSRAVLDAVGSAADPPPLAFDLSGSVEELVGRGTEAETTHRYLHAADLFVADDVAAAAYFGGPDAAVQRVAAAQRARTGRDRRNRNGDRWPRAVLTHGADGMTVVAAGAVTEFDAFDVDVVDATGAGDAFVAGLIDRWFAGSDGDDDLHREHAGDDLHREHAGDDLHREHAGVDEGVRFAAAVAALNCTSRFAQPGLSTRDEAEAFLAEREL